MRMRDLIDLVEGAFDGTLDPPVTEIDDVAHKNFGTLTGSGALAVAIYDAKEWPIFAVIGPSGRVERWVNRMPTGKYIDVYGDHDEHVLLAKGGSVKPVGRDYVYGTYQNDAENHIPIRSASNYVNAVVDQVMNPKPKPQQPATPKPTTKKASNPKRAQAPAPSSSLPPSPSPASPEPSPSPEPMSPEPSPSPEPMSPEPNPTRARNPYQASSSGIRPGQAPEPNLTRKF